KPIQCWIPQEFTRGWEEYAENYCWVANTYYASVPEEHLPAEHLRRKRMITYYQWAPIVLAVQALMYMEGCIYRQREYRRGVGVRVKHCLAKCSCLCCGKRYGNFLVVLYFFIKVLYLLNVFGQLYIMEKFVGTTYTFFGFQVLRDLFNGHTVVSVFEFSQSHVLRSAASQEARSELPSSGVFSFNSKLQRNSSLRFPIEDNQSKLPSRMGSYSVLKPTKRSCYVEHWRSDTGNAGAHRDTQPSRYHRIREDFRQRLLPNRKFGVVIIR
uniref:Innexin n=1 Tax=Macrostomum lignano TaxID=282301 RepID=A0A1I8FN98_9PLAT